MKLTPNGRDFLEDDDEKQKVIKDGVLFRVPTSRVFINDMGGVQREVIASLIDASLHRPGFALLSDAQAQARQRLHDEADKKLSAAWRNPTPLPPSFSPSTDTKAPSPAISVTDAYARHDARLRDAWRGGA